MRGRIPILASDTLLFPMCFGPNGVNGPATSFCKADNETYNQQGKAISHLLQTVVEVEVLVYGYFTG